MSEVRVHAYLARLGMGSRRQVESWVESGKVLINGKRATLGQKVNPSEDQIQIKGKKIPRLTSTPDRKVLILHKPQGVMTTMKDPEGRTTIMNLIPKKYKVFPVGRLDMMSEGLLLLTNDGELANRLTHPRYKVPKIYDVKIRGKLDRKKLDHLKRGVDVGSEKFSPAEILDVREVTKEGTPKYKVRLRVYEGKNRHVRRLFESLHCRVVRLKRVSMGTVSLRGVPVGEFRELIPSRVKKLAEAVGLSA